MTKKKSKELYMIYYFFLLTMIVVQFFPIIFERYYFITRVIIYGLSLIGITIVICKLIKLKLNRLWAYTIAITLYSIIISLPNVITQRGTISTELLVPFGIVLLSGNGLMTEIQKKYFIKYFILITTILSIAIVFYYNGGFTISDLYNIPSKNQIGPLLASAIILDIIMIAKYGVNETKIHIILGFVLFMSLLVIRNRSGISGIIITTLFFLIRYFPRSKIKRTTPIKGLVFLFLAISIILFSPLGSYAYNTVYSSLFNNYDINNIDSISAGRIDGYFSAFSFIKEHVFLGEITSPLNYIGQTPHNFIINKIVQYGFIGSMPFIFFYFYLFSIIFSKKNNSTYSKWILNLGLLVSFVEYTYPFGPGTSQFIVWFLLGQEYYWSKNLRDNF